MFKFKKLKALMKSFNKEETFATSLELLGLSAVVAGFSMVAIWLGVVVFGALCVGVSVVRQRVDST